MKTYNILTDAELEELDRLRAAACGKNLLSREAVDFAHAAHQQLGRILVEIRACRQMVKLNPDDEDRRRSAENVKHFNETWKRVCPGCKGTNLYGELAISPCPVCSGKGVV